MSDAFRTPRQNWLPLGKGVKLSTENPDMLKVLETPILLTIRLPIFSEVMEPASLKSSVHNRHPKHPSPSPTSLRSPYNPSSSHAYSTPIQHQHLPWCTFIELTPALVRYSTVSTTTSDVISLPNAYVFAILFPRPGATSKQPSSIGSVT